MFRHILFVDLLFLYRTIRIGTLGPIPGIFWRKTLAFFSLAFASILLFEGNAMAQRGEGPWEEVLPIGKVDKSIRAYVHFEDKDKKYWETPWKAAGSVRHFVEGYSYDPVTKVETFITFESPDNHRRVEFRGPDYETGTYQFEGELLIEDNVTDDVWVLQLWHAALVKYRNHGGVGTLAYHSANDATGEARVGVKQIANNVRGKKVKLNLIHSGAPSFDLELTVSVDGKPQNDGKPFKFKTFDAAGNFYIKYGAYCGPGKQQTVQWLNTRVWKKLSEEEGKSSQSSKD